MSYTNTFIEAADDCPEAEGLIPPVRGDKPSVAVLEYELLSKHPYKYTRDELLFVVHVTRLGMTPADLKQHGKQIHAELFAKPHPCMRASPLPKRYGWGIHHDEQGRIAIVSRGSPQYKALMAGDSKVATILKAMRNARTK
ncbi:MAG: DUF6157 family protein [Hyphomicrobiaceae bacterium]